jgi:O-antigen ligase
MSTIDPTIAAPRAGVLDRLLLSDLERGLIFLCPLAALLVQRGEIAGQLTPFELLFLLIVGLRITRSIGHLQGLRFAAGPVEQGFVWLGLAVAMSYLWNLLTPEGTNAGATGPDIDPGLAWKVDLLGFLSLAIVYGAYRMARSVVRSRDDFERVCLIVTSAAAINALVNAVVWLVQTGGVVARYNSDLPLTNSPGISVWMSGLGFVAGLTVLLHGRRSGWRTAALLGALALLFLSIAITVTREGQVVFLLLLGLTLLLSRKHLPRRATRLLPAVAALAGALLLWLVLSGRAREMLAPYTELNSADAQDFMIRRTMLRASWEMFRAHPFFGIGYGYFPLVNSTPVQVSTLTVFLASPHNGIASIAAELGSFGLLAALVLAGAAFSRIRRIRRDSPDPRIRGFCSFLLALITIEFVTQFVSNSLFVPLPADRNMVQLSFVLWFLIGAGSKLGVTPARGASGSRPTGGPCAPGP